MKIFSITNINSICFLFAVIILASCGLPDVVPQIKKPSLVNNSSNIVTISSSDLKPDGKPFTMYGLNIYYKMYSKPTSIIKFNSDYDAISKISGDPKTSLIQNGFTNLVKRKNSGIIDSNLPTYPLIGDQPWDLTLDCSTGSKQTIEISLGRTIGEISTSLYRFIQPDNSKGFSTILLDINSDSDLNQYKFDSSFSTTNASFGIICYVFAQDFDWSYLPLYSQPIKIGTFDIY